ncbi:MAG TPA: hypothetical protein DCZ08_04225 [Anaerolineaceae bacterium]|nr:hypothetical protein [Anaerolineaceae bacterium]
MKKNLITLAVASTLATAMVSAPAFADTSNVTVYGVASLSYDLTNNGAIGTNQVSSNQSRLGLKGSEDLGDGLSAVWQIEQQINIDNSTTKGNTFASRNSFLGLSSGSAGTFILGRHDTPYKIASRSFDVFADSIADNRSLMGGASLVTWGANNAITTNAIPTTASAGASFDGRQGDVVAYISPAMSGFTGAIAYVAGAEGATAAGTTKGSAWSLAGLYGNGPLSVNLGYEAHDLGTAPGTVGGSAAFSGKKESAWKVGAGYTMDALTVNAVYERTTDNLGSAANALFGTALAADTDVFGHNSWYLSGKYSFGNDAVKLAYTKMDNMNAALGADTGAKQVSVGYDHNLSKRTSLYGLYTKLSNGTNAQFGLSGVSTGAPAASGAGVGVSAWSFGMKHTF